MSFFFNNDTQIDGDLVVTGSIYGAAGLGADSVITNPATDVRNVISGDVSSRIVLAAKIVGDATNRWETRASGEMRWGDGTVVDTVLRRAGEGYLILETPLTGAASHWGYMTIQGASGAASAGNRGAGLQLRPRQDSNADGYELYVQNSSDKLIFYADAAGSDSGAWSHNVNGANTPGLFFGSTFDVNLYRNTADQLRTNDLLWSDGGFLTLRDLATHWALQVYAGADLEPRLVIQSDGKMLWGPGGASTRDTNLYRDSADVLKTDDSFLVNKEDGILSVDAANFRRLGFTKKAGFNPKLTFASDIGLAIAVSSTTNIDAANTFTDKLTISGIETFSFQRTFVQHGMSSGVAHLSIGKASATSGQISAAIQFLGYGIEHGYLRFRPNSTAASETFEFVKSGGDDATAGTTLFSVRADKKVVLESGGSIIFGDATEQITKGQSLVMVLALS